MRLSGSPAEFGRRVKVLIVEDESIVAMELERYLRRQGYEECARAESGEEALEMAEKFRPDVVLMDIRLNGALDGLEAAERLLARMELPIIFMSGHADVPTVQRARTISNFGFLLKPIAAEELGGILELVIQRHEVEVQRRLFEAAAQASSTAMVITEPRDSENQIVYFNPAFVAMTGYAPAEIQGNCLERSLGLAPDSNEYARFESAVRGSNPTSLLLSCRRKDGTHHQAELRITPVKDQAGRVSHRVGLFLDVTRHDLTEEHLRVQSALLNQIRDAVIVTDANHIVTFWNRGAERLYGWTFVEAVGRPLKDLVYRQQPEKADEIRAAVELGEEWTGECQHLSKSGAIILAESRCSVIQDSRGEPKGVLAINCDISDKRTTELRLRRAQQLESIGTLACGVAHDLNNILAGLSIAVDLLRSKETSAEMQEFLQALQGSTRRASEMIRQMLSFSKGIQGNTIQMSLGSLAKEITRICQATFPASIRFRTKIAPDLWDVVGNATTLHQALLNLATNARDAMPNGGTLGILLENTEIDEAFVRVEPGMKPGPFVRLQVQDTGIGIPTEVLSRIFDPFFTTKGPEKGSGLGLTMVLKAVQEHGGIIRCESETDRGTCFSIYLPACAADSRATLTQDPANSFVGRGQTVLLVDADPPTRNLMKAVLELFNLHVLVAGDGVEALTVFTENQATIWAVLSEMRLQHIDGLQLIRAIHSVSPNVPVVALIDSGDSARQADLDALNVRRLLHKPFTAEDVGGVLNTIAADGTAGGGSNQLSLGFLSIIPKLTKVGVPNH